MNRIALGAISALLFASAGLFWWQGRAQTEIGVAPPAVQEVEEVATADPLPIADIRGKRGAAPPEASEATREQRRFARLDRDIDGKITRNEMLSTRTRDFRKLDADGNNLLTFEEWAVTTGNRFRAADNNGDLWLTREEFATTKPKEKAKPRCNC